MFEEFLHIYMYFVTKYIMGTNGNMSQKIKRLSKRIKDEFTCI